MLYNLINKLDERLCFSTVSAHCDIPCKIYDPITAQLAVLTMIRMVDLLNELNEKEKLSANDNAKFYRLVAEIFWQCKGIETYTIVCPYPPEQTIVYSVLTT